MCVLFADLTGFTHLVESAEPEIVYRVVRPVLDEFVAVINRHGGDIQQVLGDGFMAVFGLHVTDGHETERAVRAALALIATHDTTTIAGVRRPAVHLGIESGEVLVTPSWEPASFGVWGRPVNLAQRLCALAGPGVVQLGPAAYDEVGPHLWPTTPTQASLKGIARPIVTHRLAPDLPDAGGLALEG